MRNSAYVCGHGRVLVGLAHAVGVVFAVDGLGAGGADLGVGRDRLAAAAQAAAWAGHELDEVALAELAAGLDVVHDLLGVGGAMGDGHLDGGAVQPVPVRHQVREDLRHRADLGDGDLGVLDALEAAHRDDVAVLVDALDLLAGDQLDDGAQGRSPSRRRWRRR